MSNEENVDSMQLEGYERENALTRFTRQISDWGLAMPPVEPLVMDFGLGKFAKVGLIEYWIANEIQAGYCGKYLFLFDGQRCPFHDHQQKHETFFIVKGKVRMIIDGDDRIMNEGDVLAMPPGQKHSFAGIGNALVLEISMPCDVNDNGFQDPAVADWLRNSLS